MALDEIFHSVTYRNVEVDYVIYESPSEKKVPQSILIAKSPVHFNLCL